MRRARLFALAGFAALALHYPLLAVFDRGARLAGIPLLPLYLFGFWLALIVAVARVLRGGRDEGED